MYDLKDSYGGNEIWMLNDQAIRRLAESYGELLEMVALLELKLTKFANANIEEQSFGTGSN